MRFQLPVRYVVVTEVKVCDTDVVCQAARQHAQLVIIQIVVAEVQDHQSFWQTSSGHQYAEPGSSLTWFW
jgi:phosphoribosylformimino-5-aminoimidazole carboxamide ribonucleotide (ProFAR) isomerase